ncbi:hypothetical protein CHUAL_004980 [Chamberlinius hualienensis]
MCTSYIIACLLFFLFHISNKATGQIVTTSNGEIEGATMSSIKGRSFYAFRGIPYAQPPVGDLRFQPPHPAKNWAGVLDATQDGNVCMQWKGSVLGNEDCLFIYVYTPYLPPMETELPVLAFFHGGGFSSGGPLYENFPPNRFMDHDAVLVIIGYRLGAFGFLSTNDSVSSGNYGLLDQVEALKWIQTNIAAFGGDKTKVTIFGQSAGAASVNYHQISNASTGLFRAAICESGSSASHWALQIDPSKWVNSLASALQCPTDNSNNSISCLKQKPAADIITATANINGYSMADSAFIPCLEDAVNGRFLTKLPDRILAEGTFNKVPAIMGTNKDDGDIYYAVEFRFSFQIFSRFYRSDASKV